MSAVDEEEFHEFRGATDGHVTEFFGLPVHEYTAESKLVADGTEAVRVGVDWDAEVPFARLFASLAADPAAATIPALVIGAWDGGFEGTDSEAAVEALVNARAAFPALKALFLGDIVSEETEISWINQCDVSPLFDAFPELEEFRVRGAQGLSLGRPSHANLRKLTVECGGLPGAVVREVAAADLPKLEHLELWLGEEGYGNDVTAEDLTALLDSPAAANLTTLALRDDADADATAKLLAERPRPGRITTLDLSMGALGDAGAEALMAADWIGSLDKLDIHFHYVTPPVTERLRAAVKELDARFRQEPDDWGDGELHRYVAVGE